MNFSLVPIVISLGPRKEIPNPIKKVSNETQPPWSPHWYQHIYSRLQGPQYPVIRNSISTSTLSMLSSKLVCSIPQGIQYPGIRNRSSTSALSMSSSRLVYPISPGDQYPGIRISISTSTQSVAMMKVCIECNPSDGKTKPISLNQVHQILSYSFCLTMPTSATRHHLSSQYLQPLSTTSPPSLCHSNILSQYLEQVSTCRPSSSNSRPCLYTHELYSRPTPNCILEWIPS